MSNEFEIEFDVDKSKTPKAPPVERKSETVEIRKEPEVIAPKKESIVQPAPVKEEPVSSPKKEEKIIVPPAPKNVDADNDDEFKKPSICEKWENWIKASSGMLFWLKAKIFFAVPALVILIIVIIVYSILLSGAKANVEELTHERDSIMQVKDSILSEKNTKIEELEKEVDKLKNENRRLQTQLQRANPRPAQKANQRPAQRR